MHSIIQWSDVTLIDTCNKKPEDGQPVAVRVGRQNPHRILARSRRKEQERTDAVIDCSQYPTWLVYGGVTKIIGRGNPPRPTPPDVALGPEELRMDVTPGQAQWVIERLIAERRISARDVSQYLDNMQGEIRDIERRLASLREAAGSGPVASPGPLREVAAAKTPGRRVSGKKGHPRGVAGTLAVLLRSIPAADHAGIAAIRAGKGIKAAIAAAKAAVKST